MLTSIDNPGWALSLIDSKFTGPKKEILKVDRSIINWVDCWTEGKSFFSFGGVENLVELFKEFEKINSISPFAPTLIPRLVAWLAKFRDEPEWYQSKGYELTQTKNTVKLSVCLEYLDWQETNQKLHLFFDRRPGYVFEFNNSWQLILSRFDNEVNMVIEDFLTLFEDEKVLPYE